MGCGNCPGAPKNTSVDKHGNYIGESEISEKEKQTQEVIAKSRGLVDEALNMSYPEYIKRKDEWRAYTRKAGKEKITTYSDDYKRILIEELVGVYNLDEVSFKLTPEQALVALYEFTHNKDYQKVINEFEGLREQIDMRYEEIKNKKINIKWKP